MVVAVVPNVSVTHNQTNINLGEGLSIPCAGGGFPLPDITWSHNGTQLPNCTRELLEMLVVCAEYRNDTENGNQKDSRGSLVIVRAKLSDAGQYVCTAENSVGVASYGVFISVQRATSMFIIYSYS